MPGPCPAERRFPFDAFLSHNSKNKPAVRQLKENLVAAGLKIWLDEDELRPGTSVQRSLEAGIKASLSIVVVVGADGVGPWEDREIRGALQLVVHEERPIIPVLLPGCPEEPELPMFLSDLKWVDLRTGFTDDGINLLRWGITGKKADGGSAADAPAPAAAPPPEPPPLTLNQILPGQWQVQIQFPFPPGVSGQLRVEMLANGMFSGQLMTPLGLTTVQGQWQANPLTRQIGLQGMQTNGFQTIPYVVMVQVGYFDRQRLTGVTSAGEQVAWQRMV